MASYSQGPITMTIDSLCKYARENTDFETIEQGIINHPEWLTEVPNGQTWGIIHHIVYHGNVNRLNRLLGPQSKNQKFRLLSITGDGKTVLDIARERMKTNEAMHRWIGRLEAMDDLLNYAKSRDWGVCKYILKKMPDIVNEKPPYRKFYFIHHLAYFGNQQLFNEFKQQCQFVLHLLTNDNKSIVDIAKDKGHTAFAQYLNGLRDKETSIYYKVQPGDTLAKIAQEKGFNLDQMKAANSELKDFDRLVPNQLIKLPLIQQLIDSTLKANPKVLDDSVTVFQHFDRRHSEPSEPSLIPECASDQKLSDIQQQLRAVFMRIDANGDGYISLEEFENFLLQLNIEMDHQDVSTLFEEINGESTDRIVFQRFYQYYEKMIKGEPTHTQSELNLLAACLKADREGKCELGGISQFINKRWKNFNNFKRDGKTGQLVMTGGAEALDVLPGEYSLVDLITWSDIKPQDIKPKFCKISDVCWIKSSKLESASGSLLLPKEFVDIRLPVEIGTNEKLAYYGCCLANESQMRVSLLHRHAIQDFTYYENYYRDFVQGRAGVERHEFAHLDCPFQEDSGFFILGKFSDENENELHLTAFKIPLKHTLYVPPLTIHSNDYLKGTWRTMLSDATYIDHVRLERERHDGEVDRLSFDFMY